MVFIGFLIGVMAGGLIMAILSGNCYEKGYEDGKGDSE